MQNLLIDGFSRVLMTTHISNRGKIQMPIYEYQCQSCGASLEKLQKINDAPLTKCEVCGADALKKQISAAGFRLKGTGWYETDFKKSNKKNLAGSSDSKD